MQMRGIRGATTVMENTKDEISKATQELLQHMVQKNNIVLDSICAIFFTVTSDLNANFPATAARELGWVSIPFLCSTEIPVPGSLAKCIRILILLNTDQEQAEIHHIYLNNAQKLRPDLQ